MEIKIVNHYYSDYKVRQVKRALDIHAPRILGRERSAGINKLTVEIRKRLHKRRDFSRGFIRMWNEETGIARIWMARNWMEARSPSTVEWGAKHELIHLRQLIDGDLIPEEPKKNEHFRCWWRHDDGIHYLYNKPANEDVMWHLYETDYKSMVNYVCYYYPWEFDALTHGNRIQNDL